jgi:hypothetical protein
MGTAASVTFEPDLPTSLRCLASYSEITRCRPDHRHFGQALFLSSATRNYLRLRLISRQAPRVWEATLSELRSVLEGPGRSAL